MQRKPGTSIPLEVILKGMLGRYWLGVRKLEVVFIHNFYRLISSFISTHLFWPNPHSVAAVQKSVCLRPFVKSTNAIDQSFGKKEGEQ